MCEVIFGIHPIQALLEKDHKRLQKIFISKGNTNRFNLLIDKLKKYDNVSINFTTRQWLDKKVGRVVHQGIIAFIKSNPLPREEDLPQMLLKITKPFLLILDNITDPHNLGACLRSANIAGVHIVIIPKNRCAPLNATAKKVACGAAESTPLIQVTNLVRTMQLLKKHNIWILGADISVNNILYKSKINGAVALVVGNESKGMRRLTIDQCDELISIPNFGNINSLNVSAATAVCLFEIVRQNNFE
ncbi:23S rRNA (guanosine(2251)-2'-O)-methyltransferase RlmB [Candidatus Ishikawella capsulata]|nr:23S rRNA (guanosine(2251)-2'-O)-methyltransferase RlmB [Candidatus Ishikawaella capsulata]